MDYFTYIITDLSLTRGSRIRYSGPPGFFAEEATGASEAVLGLPRLGGTAASGACGVEWSGPSPGVDTWL